jgi:RNA-directed DNA polymerase
MRESKLQGKSFDIPKRLVWEAWLRVQENDGAAGPDGVSVAQFAGCVEDGLYKLWNRMSSGSYFPGPVRAVEIPKGNGGVRVLGIPNVIDRVAQTAMAMWLEPGLEKLFHPDSYGYRPGRSPHDALRVCRQRCWSSDWVIDMDIKAFFDSVSWDLMLRAVAQQTDQKWILMYLERCLKAPMRTADGTLIERTKGTPQGGLCSAEHKDPNEQCWVMRSVGLSGLVRAALGIERCA